MVLEQIVYEGANKLSNQDKKHFKEVFLRLEIIGKKSKRSKISTF